MESSKLPFLSPRYSGPRSDWIDSVRPVPHQVEYKHAVEPVLPIDFKAIAQAGESNNTKFRPFRQENDPPFPRPPRNEGLGMTF